MQLKAGIFWGGQEAQHSYESASAIFQQLDAQRFEALFFFVDQQQQIYAISPEDFIRGQWSLQSPIDPQDIRQIDFAFVELWQEDSHDLLHWLETLQLPYVGQTAAARTTTVPGKLETSLGQPFSCLVIDRPEASPLALYPKLHSPGAALTTLQLEQIRTKSAQFYQQMELSPFACIRGRYTTEDILFFDPPQLARPLAHTGYLRQEMAHYNWTPQDCCTYSVLVAVYRHLRENPGVPGYRRLYKQLLAQQTAPSRDQPIAVLIGADSPTRSQAQAAAHYFTQLASSITDRPIRVYECLAANSQTSLRRIDLTAEHPAQNRQAELFEAIAAQCQQLKTRFISGEQESASASIPLAALTADYAYLCLDRKYGRGFLQYALDEAKIPHNGAALQHIQQIDRLLTTVTEPEPGRVHLLSSIWCDPDDGCTLLGHSLIEKDGQLFTPARHRLLALNDPAVQHNIRQALRDLLPPCTPGTYAVIESYLRIFEDNSVQISVVQADTTPLLWPEHVLFAHAKDAGLQATTVFERLLKPVLTKPSALTNSRSASTMVNENEELTPQQEPLTPAEENSAAPIDDSAGPEATPGVFMRIWQQIKSLAVAPVFWRNLGAIMVAGLLFYGLIHLFLGLYTRHGSPQVVVESYLDQPFETARRQARDKGLKVVITDSTFVIGMPPNMVIEQDPKPGSKVKKRRTIYLWVTGGQAPEVLLPNLAGKDDFDTYQRELDRRGIELSIKERQFDSKLEENTILGFYYQGQPVSLEQIRAGFKVPKGSQMQAVISRRSDGMVAIPDLICQTFEAARFELESNQLRIGEVYGTRDEQAYVWKQEPAYTNGQRIPVGSTITLHLTSEQPAGCQ